MEKQPAGGTCSSQRTKSAWVVPCVALSRMGGRGFCHQHPGRQLLPSLLRTIQGEAGRNVGMVPGAATSLHAGGKC